MTWNKKFIPPKLFIVTTRVSLLVSQRWIIFQRVKNVFAAFGVISLLFLLFLFIQGKRAIYPFESEFGLFFTRFVEQILKKEVASAMVVKAPLEKGVTIQQAIDSMKLYANRYNLKFITSHPLHKQIKIETGESSKVFEVFEFCDITLVTALLKHNPDFLVHFPCRIAIYQDNSDQTWLVTLDLSLLLHGTRGLDPKVKAQAMKIQDGLLKIMGAGASGAS